MTNRRNEDYDREEADYNLRIDAARGLDDSDKLTEACYEKLREGYAPRNNSEVALHNKYIEDTMNKAEYGWD